jgi:hypothetical protein
MSGFFYLSLPESTLLEFQPVLLINNFIAQSEAEAIETRPAANLSAIHNKAGFSLREKI